MLLYKYTDLKLYVGCFMPFCVLMYHLLVACGPGDLNLLIHCYFHW